jgi:hypothetical protein
LSNDLEDGLGDRIELLLQVAARLVLAGRVPELELARQGPVGEVECL